jgi:diguanylate cyclase (GGDEF)-like protein
MSVADGVRIFGRDWLRYVRHGAALVGAVLIALVWLSISFFLENERNSAEQSAIKNAMNLAGAFEEHLSRSLAEIDRSIKIVRTRYLRSPSGTDAAVGRLKTDELFNEDVLQVSIIGADGFVKHSSLATSQVAGMNFSDREHFLVHRTRQGDELFISKPVVGRGSGKWSIQLTRRIDNGDGSFGGIVVASLDPAYLTAIYSAVNTGNDGMIRVVGTDGVIRATSSSSSFMLGRDLSEGALFKVFERQTTGWQYVPSRFSDQVPRLVVFRAVKNYPLIITIGQSTQEIFALLDVKQRFGYLIASILTLLIIAVTVVSINGSLAREEDRKRLELMNLRLNATLANMPHGVCMFNADKVLMLANDLYRTMYGLTPEQVRPGTSLQDILKARVAVGSSPKDGDKYIAERLIDAASPRPTYIVDELRDGRTLSISRQSMPDGGSVAIHQDITTQKKAEEKISQLAHYDALTSLANRARFLDYVGAAAKQARQHGKRFAVHLLDLDRFKEVNDSLGHAAGDALLFEIASRLRGAVGPDDVVARLGGDEFTVLQAIGEAGADDAVALAKMLLQVISQPFDIDGHHLAIETSIGLALTPDHGLVANELLKRADLALYRAKSDGRNGWRVFEPDMERAAHAQLALAMNLRNSVAREEFELHYQPFVEMTTETVIGAEALVRWRDGKGGLTAPNHFIPLAEDTGLIIPLGEWVLRRACRDAAGWPSHIRLAVNLSPVQIRGSDIVEMVKRTLAQSGFPAARLELEVTESVLLQHNEHSLKALHQLRELGIAIVLDDFGTGYSSMSYLLSFPFDKIKIDRKFVAELPRRNDCAAIVSAVSGLARSLDIATTAEGVETAEQLTLLRAAGCTLAQGYLFGRPCANAELEFGDKPVLHGRLAGI